MGIHIHKFLILILAFPQLIPPPPTRMQDEPRDRRVSAALVSEYVASRLRGRPCQASHPGPVQMTLCTCIYIACRLLDTSYTPFVGMVSSTCLFWAYPRAFSGRDETKEGKTPTRLVSSLLGDVLFGLFAQPLISKPVTSNHDLVPPILAA